MKLLYCCIAAALLSTNTLAQSACTSGVYQMIMNPGFYSVHVNGNTALIVSLSWIPASGISVSVPGVGAAKPTQLDTWNYAIGEFDGEKYNVSGTTLYGSCNWSGTVRCDAVGGASVTLDSISKTTAGSAWGVNCDALMSAAQQAGVRRLSKIF